MKTWLAAFFLASMAAFGQQQSISQIPDCSLGFCSGLGVPTFNCNTGWKYAQVDNAGHNFTCTGIPPHWVADAGGGGGASLPAANQVISGDGLGNGIAMPEKGTKLVTGTPNTAAVAWDEDVANGRFDCRNTAYAGGCLGATPGAALQAFSDALVCYQGITGKHARTVFPPGTFAVGTDTYPTLKLPTGVIYDGGSGWGYGTNAVQFQSTYNNHAAVEFDNGLTSTTNCSDGVPHTSNLAQGSYDGFSEHGCAQGGCRNVPGDSGNYPFGGPLQTGIVINDIDGSIGTKAGVFANENGADGVLCNGRDSHCGEIGGAANNGYFIYGMDTAGQNYQFSAGECHGEVVLGGLDNMNPGPFETYGQFATPGAEYGHLAGICWSGGLTYLGPYFLQIQEIGIIHMAGGNTETGAMSGRIDAPRGTGILEMSNGKTTWETPRVIAACRFDGLNDYIVSSVAVATPGSGQTPGTYLLTASSGSAQISVTVAAGGTVTANPAVTVNGRGYTSTPPTFTLAAGGTPATFTVTMHSVFYQPGTGTPNNSCDYITELSAGKDTYVAPLMTDNSFFGADHSTGDFYPGSFGHRIIAPIGNGVSGHIKIDPAISNTLNQPTNWQNSIIDADPVKALGGTQASGTVIDLNATGYHVAMVNTSATTLTAVNNGLEATPIYITGDGFTTMPYVPGMLGGGGTVFGANNCSGHPQLLQKDHRYTYEIVSGQSLGQPVTLNEECGGTFSDYFQPGFSYLAANGALPAVSSQATLDAAGSIAVRSLPALPAIQVTTAGTGSGFSYCYAVEAWVAGGKQTTPLTCNSVTPTTVSASHNVQVHLPLPINWTRYKVFLNSTTDPSFTPGVWYDISAPNGLPQPASCDLETITGCSGGIGSGRFITPFTPTDTSTIPPSEIGLNMTGTYNFDPSNIPAGSAWPGSFGQVQIDPGAGVLWYATADDTWKSWSLEANSADGEVPAGVIDGTNVTFTLANPPNPASSLHLYRNGLRLVSPTDYTISGNTITYANPPSPGDTHVADYSF